MKNEKDKVPNEKIAGNNAGCGCQHEHNHDEYEHCGCGHEHGEHEHAAHSHDEHEHCGCGHEHGEHEHAVHNHEQHEHCGCGHEHGHSAHCHDEHSHVQHEHCGCGHEHSHAAHCHDEHNYEHHEHCNCGHEHSEHEHAAHTHEHHEHRTPESTADLKQQIYLLENLGCANCAAKMEEKISALPGVASASITFATGQLRVSADNHEALLPKIQEICSSIEAQVKVVPRFKQEKAGITKTYLVDHLDCAHCASKMEEKINQLPEVLSATLTYATKQLKITAKRDPDLLLPAVKAVCQNIEAQVTIEPKAPAPKTAEASSGEAHKQESPEKGISENAKTLALLLSGAALFAAGLLLESMHMETPSVLLFLAGYVLLGGRIVLTALRNLSKGHVFDENFLMSVATIGALVIQEFPEAVGVMLFYRIGEYFEHRAVERSRTQIMGAVDMRPETVTLVIGNETRTIPAQDAAVGDLLVIRPGDRIPLDGIVTEGESRIDTSPVTGEPVPVRVTAGSQLTSGCVNTSGLLKMKVEKVLEESMVTRILDAVENAAASKPQIDRFITRFSRVYTPFVVILALATAIIPSLFTGNWGHWVYTALTFLVISCPCALVLSVPLAFFSGIGAGSKKGILFKGGVSLEAMKNVKAVILDKTGTLTKGNFAVQEIQPVSDMEKETLLSLCASCELNSTHPIGHSIVTAAKEQGISPVRPESVEEIPGCGIRAVLPQGTVLCGNRKLMERFDISMSHAAENQAGTEVFAAFNNRFIGSLVIADTLKEDAKSAVGHLKALGITPAMLTGDARESADAIASAVGIEEVRARLLPQDKLTELQRLKKDYGAVMFVGDGINDAPVLAGADVGAAMGSGADAAIEAADVVFMNSSVEAVPQAVSIARSTTKIAWQNVVFALIIKALVMVLGLFGIASMWLAVFADTGVAMLCVLNSIRILYSRK